MARGGQVGPGWRWAGALGLLVLASCGAPERDVAVPDPDRQAALVAACGVDPDDLTGEATWYGADFQGRRTASGEPFDMHAFTAAHPTLPFGTIIRVIRLDTRQSVVVRVNDRGPYGRGRVVDLSRAAAEEIGLIGPGHRPVTIELLALPD